MIRMIRHNGETGRDVDDDVVGTDDDKVREAWIKMGEIEVAHASWE
jgi:hypothetical protein